MKTIQNTLRQVLSIIAILVLAIVTVPALANENKENGTIEKRETPVVKYIGTVNMSPVYEIQFNNASQEALVITLKDEEGNTLYTENFAGSKYAKKFQFERADASDLKLQLVLTSKHNNQSQSFQINKSVRVVEDVVISKIN